MDRIMDYLEFVEYRNSLHADRVKLWENKGRDIFSDQYLQFWERVIPFMLLDPSSVVELECTINVVKSLNSGASIEDAVVIANQLENPKVALHTVRGLVKKLCDRGQEFDDYYFKKQS